MKILIKIIFPITIVFLLMYFFSYNISINRPVNMNGEATEFVIKTGDSVDRISANLEKIKLINSAHHFKTYVWFKNLGAKLQAGTFLISPAMNVKEIVDMLVLGESINRERDVKIIEGWQISDINEYIAKNDILENNNYSNLALNKIDEWNFDFNKPVFLDNLPVEANLEGYLFPDTYKIFLDASAEDLIEKQLNHFDTKLSQDLKDEIIKQKKSIHEIITMASIIEKEVSLDKDRAIVSGILYKRINIGMRLEVDSTINYITGKNDPSAEYKDLEIDSPYNTYKYYGLPPGPICNPGLSAIRAAIYPESSQYLFYLNRQDTKETVFSKDYNEHLRNKAKYLK